METSLWIWKYHHEYEKVDVKFKTPLLNLKVRYQLENVNINLETWFLTLKRHFEVEAKIRFIPTLFIDFQLKR